MPEVPTGTVTFLFTDIEGSTTRWEHHPDAMRTALARHDALLRSVIVAHGGFVFKMVGDAVYSAFAVAADAVAAAVAAQRAVAAESWGEVGPLRVRMAMHTGTAQSRDDDYFGPTLNRVARVLSAGYGGQILLSIATVELVRDALPAGVSVQDLGEHALKDLRRPEHVYQLTSPDLPSEFPPLKSLERHAHNLPMQPTPFVGREQEVASVRELLRRPEVRLLTLTGPGGIGKTRLALQVAAELSDQFADGVFLVPLAPVNDPEQVVPAIIQTLGISDLSGQAPLTLLKTALKDKQMLLLFDNFEQVASAALMVAELLAVCPRLTVLVTSRMALHVRAEREFVVPPLSVPNLKRLPDLVTLSQYEAVALFIERSQAAKPDFAVTNANASAVAAICARLDGLPLAIELAAARSKYAPPQTLLTRLEQGLAVLSGGARDLPARQQTLRGAMAWSYELLSPEEQRLFRRLSVFVDGCTWDAAEQVATVAGGLPGDIMEGLESLVDKSLLRQAEQAEGGQGGEQEARFWMLQTLREFGLEALAASGEMEDTRQAHAVYYLRLAEEAEPELGGPQQAMWLERLAREHDNLRAAMQCSLEQAGNEETGNGREMALRLGRALLPFWLIRSHYREGRTFLERALVGSQGVATLVRAKALGAAARLALNLDDFDQGEALCQESLTLYRELADTAGIAVSLYWLGTAAKGRGNFPLARSLIEEAQALWRKLDDKEGVAWPLLDLAYIVSSQGEYARGRALFGESLALFRQLGNKGGIAVSLRVLAEVLLGSQDDPTVHALLEESLRLAREVGDKDSIAFCFSLLGQAVLSQGDADRARSLLEESVTLFRETGNRWGIAQSLSVLARGEVRQGNYAAARALYEESLAIAKAGNFQGHIALGLEGLAGVVSAQGEPIWAARLWGLAEALREAMGAPIPPIERVDYERSVAAVRTQLGGKAFAAAWAEGRTMPLEQAITNALSAAG